MNKLFSNEFKLKTNAQRATLNGVDYLVAPNVVAVREMVLNGFFLPADEISFFPQAWNGVAVPISHPQKNGSFVSANTPETTAERVVGRLFNARFDKKQKLLIGDVWVDIEQAKRVKGGRKLLKSLTNGEQIEVSTAYSAHIEKASGVYNGRSYNAIQRDIRPDHFALLLDEVGACSISDGCGIVANCSTECSCQKFSGEKDMKENQTEEDELVVANEATEAVETAETADTQATDVEVDETVEEEDNVEDTAELVEAEVDEISSIDRLAELTEEFGGLDAVVETLEAVQTNRRQERQELVEAIVGNSELTAEQLADASTDFLKALKATLATNAEDEVKKERVADYSGRGVQKATKVANTESVNPPSVLLG